MRIKRPTSNIQHPTPNQTGRSLGVRRSEGGSVLIIVLWIALGLVSITLYFANSSSFELQASDNRVSGLATEESIDGAARYVSYILANYATNGAMPDQTYYQAAAVAVGDSHFWLIGRDTNSTPLHPDQVTFGITDENSKVNINTATYDMLVNLPRITTDLAANIVSWRTNGDTSSGGVGPEQYAMLSPPYAPKGEPFETTDELRLVYGADMDTLVGEDANRNGVLDPNETDQNHNSIADAGVLEYVTVYTREPNTNFNGSAPINVRSLTPATMSQLASLFSTNFTSQRASNIMAQLRNNNGNNRSPLRFYLRSGMTSDEFALIADHITTVTNAYIEGRINVNTATAAVLACIPGLSNRVDDLISYRQSNPDRLTSVAWVIDALNIRGDQATTLVNQIGNRITTKSYQFMADVAAVGPNNRGYRRVRFIFDTSEGTPRIIYRREMTHLGWALGKDVRQVLLAKNTQQ